MINWSVVLFVSDGRSYMLVLTRWGYKLLPWTTGTRGGCENIPIKHCLVGQPGKVCTRECLVFPQRPMTADFEGIPTSDLISWERASIYLLMLSAKETTGTIL